MYMMFAGWYEKGGTCVLEQPDHIMGVKRLGFP